MMRRTSHLPPVWRLVRLCFFAVLIAAPLMTSAACGRDSRQGASEVNNLKPDQAGPAAPFGLNRIGRGNAYGTRSINMDDLDHAHRHGGGIINQANKGGAAIYDSNAGRTMNVDNNAETRVEASQSIADAIAALDEVKTANVLLTNQNAYVAVVLEYGAGVSNAADGDTQNRTVTDVSDQVKRKIAEKVKATNTDIRNVYVSASPDFVERMSSFRQDIQNGKPVAGFIKEFYNVIERVFPTRAGNNNPVLNP